MKTCSCGGKMYRKGHSVLKRSNEEKMRFRCIDCKRWEMYYRKIGETEWHPETRPGHRPASDDGEFKWKD